MRCCNALRGGMKLLSQHYVIRARQISHKCHSCAAMALVRGLGIVSVGVALSMLVCLYGNMMTGARIPFAMSRERCFFHALAQVHPRFRTPPTANRCAGRARRCAHALGAELPAVVLAHFICRVRLLHSGDGVGLRRDSRWMSRTTSRFLARLLCFPAASSRVGSCLARGCRRSVPAFPRRAAATGNGDRRDNRAG
jgi:hypothetical protein